MRETATEPVIIFLVGQGRWPDMRSIAARSLLRAYAQTLGDSHAPVSRSGLLGGFLGRLARVEPFAPSGRLAGVAGGLVEPHESLYGLGQPGFPIGRDRCFALLHP